MYRPISAFLALLRLLSVTAGRAAVIAGAPLYFGLILVCGVLFGGNGMDAKDATRLLLLHPFARLFLFWLFVLLSWPVARAIFATPASLPLRALPAPRVWFYGIHLLHLSVAELPPVVLFGRGEGSLWGVAVLGLCLVGHVLCLGLAAPSKVRFGAVVLCVFGICLGLLMKQPSSWLLVGVALLGLVVGVPAAFLAAPLRASGGARSYVGGSAGVALALVYLALLLRKHGALLSRCVIYCLLTLGVATVALSNNRIPHGEPRVALVLCLSTPTVALCVATLCGAVLRTELGALWLLQTTYTGPLRRMVGVGVALTVPSAILGAALALGMGLLAQEPPLTRLRMAMDAVLAALLLAQILQVALRPAVAEGDKGTETVYLISLLSVVGSAVLAYLFHEAALGILGLMALCGVVFFGPPQRGTRAYVRIQRRSLARGTYGT